MSQPNALVLTGDDTYGNPRQKFADKLAAASDEEYLKIAEDRIWIAVFASSNPKSDFHWQVDACYDEAERRGNPRLYDIAWEQAGNVCPACGG